MSTEFSGLLDRLLDGESIAEPEAAALMHALAEGEMDAALAGGLLAALRAKGETAEEIRGFATAMRELAVHPDIPEGPPTVDTVGTGGDGSGSLNLSTGTGLLAAACGARVVKHGNRAVSSRSGSADMLECLGMPLPLAEQAAIDCLEATNFTFLFAPAYGYGPARERFAQDALSFGDNVVVLSGDTHNSWAFDLLDRSGRQFGVELGTTSVTSPGLESGFSLAPEELVRRLQSVNPHLRFANTKDRGYMVLTVGREEVLAEWLYVDTVESRDFVERLGAVARLRPSQGPGSNPLEIG